MPARPAAQQPAHLRTVLDDFTYDQQKAPQQLKDLVSGRLAADIKPEPLYTEAFHRHAHALEPLPSRAVQAFLPREPQRKALKQNQGTDDQ